MPKRKSDDVESEIQDIDRSPLYQIVFPLLGGPALRRVILLIGIILVTSCNGTITISTDGGSSGSGGGSGGGNSAPPAGGGQANSIAGLPSLSFKQQSKEITFDGCPPQGDGGDPVLNMNKNRVDVGNFQPVAFDTIEKLPWPKETEKKAHADWSPSAQAQVAQAEGLPVMVEGYLALARQEGPETPNCHSSTDFDFHIWMIRAPGGTAARTEAVVVEATPRVRANHPGWTVNNLNKIAKRGTSVRISGWLMLDPEHPEQLGQTRGTLWEIHPIIQIEVSQGSQWIKLDNYNG